MAEGVLGSFTDFDPHELWDVVEIRFRDPSSLSGSWTAHQKMSEDAHPSVCWAVGFRMEHTKTKGANLGCVILCTNVSEMGDVKDTFSVPTGCIEKITVLKKRRQKRKRR